MSKNEAQTRTDLINPKLLTRGWTSDLIKVETTPGGTDIIDGKPRRRLGRADYLLCIRFEKTDNPIPVAIIEAKKEDTDPALGLQQAREYAKRFNVPFAFSSNGHLFVEFAEDTDKITKPDKLDKFPTPQELRLRYQQFKGINLADNLAKPLLVGYKKEMFYFQDAAIRATIEKLAIASKPEEKRALLSLATGTGKTVIATQLLYKFVQAGHVKRALFVCDREELRDQALGAMQSFFGADAMIVTTFKDTVDNYGIDKRKLWKNAKILIATYQTLNITAEDKAPVFWKENFPADYFSHIIIDECHRSAWGNWSVILTDNPNAVQIGLTATPRIIKGEDNSEKIKDIEVTAHNIKYFGEPVYEYSISQGQDDGYLAKAEIYKRKADIDKKIIQQKEVLEKKSHVTNTGETPQVNEVKERYKAAGYDRELMLDDRQIAMTDDLFEFLLKTNQNNPHQKSIIFCASDTHATEIANKLENRYKAWCKQQNLKPKEMFAFRVTATCQNPTAKALLSDLKGQTNSHFIATTVDLLSTGVDVPNLNNVVFFRYLNSPILFYQMVGRGTRIGEPRGTKMMFRIYDYTDATRLFGEDFISVPPPKGGGGGEPPEPRPFKQITIEQEQYQVQISDEGHFILCNEEGQDVLVPYETYKQRLADAVANKISTINNLRVVWINPQSRKELLEMLPGGENAIRLVRELENMKESDLYDILAWLAFKIKPLKRTERTAFFEKINQDWLSELPERTKNVLIAIAQQFEKGGIEELETERLFDIAEIVENGGISALLGLKEKPFYYIEQTKIRLLAA